MCGITALQEPVSGHEPDGTSEEEEGVEFREGISEGGAFKLI